VTSRRVSKKAAAKVPSDIEVPGVETPEGAAEEAEAAEVKVVDAEKQADEPADTTSTGA
jgi:hypothetical protein